MALIPWPSWGRLGLWDISLMSSRLLSPKLALRWERRKEGHQPHEWQPFPH